METLTISLNIEGKEKVFKATGFVNQSVLDKSVDLTGALHANAGTDFNQEIIQSRCYSMVCETFDNQFTVEQLKKELDKDEILTFTLKAVNYVVKNAFQESVTKKTERKGEVIPFGKHPKRNVKA